MGLLPKGNAVLCGISWAASPSAVLNITEVRGVAVDGRTQAIAE